MVIIEFLEKQLWLYPFFSLAGPNCEKPGPSKEEQALESAESH